jgi:2-dehydropantoate 2-reductase
MHFVIIGSGAVGGYFGARLAQAGNQVTFIARGEHLKVMEKSGLALKSINGDFHLSDPNVVENTDNIENVEVILLAVKAFQLSSTIALLKPVISKHTRIIPLLNGINAAQKLIELGICSINIYGGLAKIISKVSSPGVISHTGAEPHITLGRLNIEQYVSSENDANSESIEVEQKRLEEISNVLSLANISCGLSNNIELALWRKFIFVAAWGALASLDNKSVGEMRSDINRKEKLVAIVDEYALIANAEQINITKALVEQTLKFLYSLPEHSKTSMQRDIAQGHLSEFDVLVKYPFQLSQKHQLYTPVLNECYQQLSL